MLGSNWCTFSSAAKKFVHRNAFDDEYGTKASTRPAFMLDTDEEPVSKQGENSLILKLAVPLFPNPNYRKRKYDLHEEKTERFDNINSSS